MAVVVEGGEGGWGGGGGLRKNVGHHGWARVKKKLAKMPWHDQSFFLISDFLVESVKANKN